MASNILAARMSTDATLITLAERRDY